MSLRDEVARAVDTAFHNPASSDDWSDEVDAALAVVRRHIKARLHRPNGERVRKNGMYEWEPDERPGLKAALALIDEDAP